LAGKDVTGKLKERQGSILTQFCTAPSEWLADEFYGLHRQDVLIKYAPRLKIGIIANEEPSIKIAQPGDFSTVPYAEPSFWMGFHSPYFT
jgi:hypothetical protein